MAPVFSQNAPSTDAARWERQAQNVTIIRDDWGIPHVYGKTDADAVFGMIYAQAEDDFNRVETNFMTQLGRRAEADGEAMVYQDLRSKLFNDEDLLDCVRRALARSVQHRAEQASRHDVQARLDQLTKREHQVMLEVITGKLNKQIAADLGISEKTIKVHRGRVMQKMRVNSVVELARLIEKSGAPSV